MLNFGTELYEALDDLSEDGGMIYFNLTIGF
jgi:hypothetical protein